MPSVALSQHIFTASGKIIYDTFTVKYQVPTFSPISTKDHYATASLYPICVRAEALQASLRLARKTRGRLTGQSRPSVHDFQ